MVGDKSQNSDDENLTLDATPAGKCREDFVNLQREKAPLSPKNESKSPSPPPQSYKPKTPKHGTSKGKPSNKASQKVVQYNISNASNVHIGSNYVVNVNKSTDNVGTSPNASPRAKMEKTKDVEDLMCNKNSITRPIMLCAATHIGKNWRDVAKRLDLSNGQIEQFYEMHIKTSLKEVIYQMLLDWSQDKPELATIGNLTLILWECEEYDAVVRLLTENQTSTRQ